MRSSNRFMLGLCVALSFAVSSVANAVEYIAPMIHRAAVQYEGYDKAFTQFKAELAHNYGQRIPEAGRANGLVKESNGFRLAALVKGLGQNIEVGWQQTPLNKTSA